MKKTRYLLCFFAIAMLLITTVSAETISEEEDTAELQQQLQDEATGELNEAIPENAQNFLQKNSIDGYDVDTMTNFQFTDFFGSIWDSITEQIGQPLVLLGSIIGVLLLASMLSSLNTGDGQLGLQSQYTLVSVAAVMLIIVQPIIDCINSAVDAIYECSLFILSFIPVFTGMVAASGKPLSSLAYNSFLFGVIQVISQIATSTLVPLLGIYLALCVVSSLNPAIDLQGLASGIKKFVMWVLVGMLTIFVTLLTVQGFIAGSADTVTSKTAKFLIGSTIPVVGSALSEAYSSVKGCLGLMRDVTGTFGIIVTLATFIPPLIQVGVMTLAVNIGELVGRVLGSEKVCAMLKAVSSVLTLILGIILCYAVMIIVSTTIIMMISLGM